MRKYYNKISLWSRIINHSFILTSCKKNTSTVERTMKYISKLAITQKNYNLPDVFGLTLEDFDGMKVYSYNGSISKENDRKIIYIHGGSYVEEAMSFQIKFAMEIAKKTNSTLIFPIYPLAPNNNYKITYDLMEKLYKLVSKYSNNIDFLGDSAGGGFILSFAMFLRDIKENQPLNIIMLSPWLDISMSNPDLYVAEKHDHMCGIDGTRYEGQLWADGLDIKNYLVSPMFGEFNNLGKMTIITGEREVINSDCHLLDNKLNDLKIEHNFIEYKKQGHDFGTFPTKEGKMVIEDISKIIRGQI